MYRKGIVGMAEATAIKVESTVEAILVVVKFKFATSLSTGIRTRK